MHNRGHAAICRVADSPAHNAHPMKSGQAGEALPGVRLKNAQIWPAEPFPMSLVCLH